MATWIKKVLCLSDWLKVADHKDKAYGRGVDSLIKCLKLLFESKSGPTGITCGVWYQMGVLQDRNATPQNLM